MDFLSSPKFWECRSIPVQPLILPFCHQSNSSIFLSLLSLSRCGQQLDVFLPSEHANQHHQVISLKLLSSSSIFLYLGVEWGHARHPSLKYLLSSLTLLNLSRRSCWLLCLQMFSRERYNMWFSKLKPLQNSFCFNVIVPGTLKSQRTSVFLCPSSSCPTRRLIDQGSA